MTRPREKTKQLLRDDMYVIRHLFGTARNAYERLRLDEAGVKFEEFRRALAWYHVRPAVVDAISDRWLNWKLQFQNFSLEVESFTFKPASEAGTHTSHLETEPS